LTAQHRQPPGLEPDAHRRLLSFASWALSQKNRTDDLVDVASAAGRLMDTPDFRLVLAHAATTEGLLDASFTPGMSHDEALWRDGRKAAIATLIGLALSAGAFEKIMAEQGLIDEEPPHE
jgi:hypothetical protein